MEHFTVTLDDYRKALDTATDSSYKTHLEKDFIVTIDGKVLPRVDFVKTSKRINQ